MLADIKIFSLIHALRLLDYYYIYRSCELYNIAGNYGVSRFMVYQEYAIRL